MGSGIDVLLGDFSTDVLDEVAYRRLKDTLSGCNLKVLEPTHLDVHYQIMYTYIRNLNMINLQCLLLIISTFQIIML